MYEQFQIIAFTHNNLDVSEIGLLHIADENQKLALNSLKEEMGWSEFLFLSTCNRVEFLFCGTASLSPDRMSKLFSTLYKNLDAATIKRFTQVASTFEGEQATNHLFRVASSIDSMVVGEREIITQVRTAYEKCSAMGLTGDFLRLAIKQTIAIAKNVYTHTDISKKPVSVVSLAYHRMKELNVPLDARVVIVGAGSTNTTLSRFLKKHGYTKFVVFNRTLSKAEELSKELNGRAFPLETISEYQEGFDVLIACTGSDSHLVTPELYESLLKGETDKKLVIDIAIPQDLDPRILEKHNVFHISVSYLQKISDANLKERSSEIDKVEAMIAEALVGFGLLYRERAIELAMRSVPQTVKDIKSTAMNEVFKQEIDGLDENSKEILEKVMVYMEKKYMSVPMKMAKDILLKA